MADRWVCKSCWTSNEEAWGTCLRCRTPRGAEGSALPGASTAAADGKAPRRWRFNPMQFAGIGVIAVLGIFGALTAASRDDSGAIVEEGTLHITDVRVGDCFDLNEGPDVEEVGDIRAVPCEEPHSFEAYFTTELAAGDYPTRSVLDAEAEAACLPSFEPYVGHDYETSELYVTTFEPTPEGWNLNDRSLLCVISTENAATPLTGSVRGSGR